MRSPSCERDLSGAIATQEISLLNMGLEIIIHSSRKSIMSWDQPLSSSETKSIVSKAVDNAISGMEYAFDKRLMELATSQARAMQDLGSHIDDNLYRIDDANNRRFLELTNGLVKFSQHVDVTFKETNQRINHVLDGIDDISDQLNDIADRLDEIEFNTANPDLVRAHERYRSAMNLARRGHPQEALAQVDAAIENAGGAKLSHIPEFQLFKAGLLLRPDTELYDPETAMSCLEQADKFAADEWNKTRRARINYLAAQAAIALQDPFRAGLEFALCAVLMQNKTKRPAHLDPSGLLYNTARQYLIGLQDLLQDSDPLPEEVLRPWHDRVRYALGLAIRMDWRLIARIPTDPAMMNQEDVVIPVLEEFWAEQGPRARGVVRQFLAWFDDKTIEKINAKMTAVSELAQPKDATIKPPRSVANMCRCDIEDETLQTLRDLAQDSSRPLDFVKAASSMNTVAFRFKWSVTKNIIQNRENLSALIKDIDAEGGYFITIKDAFASYSREELHSREVAIAKAEGYDFTPPSRPPAQRSFFHGKRQKLLEADYKQKRQAWEDERRAFHLRAVEDVKTHNAQVTSEYKKRAQAVRSLAQDVDAYLSSLKLPPEYMVRIGTNGLTIDFKRV